eukprot:9492391-Pyramimonas_sp.AAC.1
MDGSASLQWSVDCAAPATVHSRVNGVLLEDGRVLSSKQNLSLNSHISEKPLPYIVKTAYQRLRAGLQKLIAHFMKIATDSDPPLNSQPHSHAVGQMTLYTACFSLHVLVKDRLFTNDLCSNIITIKKSVRRKESK